MGDVCRRREERSLVFALAFDNGLTYCQAAFKRLNGDNLATLCTNFVNFRPIVMEFTLLKRAIIAVIPTQFDDDLHVMLAFRNGLENRNFDFRRVIGNHFCTSCRNLVRFDLVTPEFKTQRNCTVGIENLSVVTSGMFSRGWGC